MEASQIASTLAEFKREDGSKLVLGTFACTARRCLAGQPQAVLDVILSLVILIIRATPVQLGGIGQSLGIVEVKVTLMVPEEFRIVDLRGAGKAAEGDETKRRDRYRR